MLIAVVSILLIFSNEQCTAVFPILSKIKRMIGIETKDENIKGSFKTVKYLGSVVKLPCFGKKHPTQIMGRFDWYRSGKRISNALHYSTDHYGMLTINDVAAEDSGTFICQSNSKSGKFIFKHHVMVVQFPSKSVHVHFTYTLRLCTQENEEFAKRFIESKVRGAVCASNECKLSYIHGECHFDEFGNPSLKVTVPIMLPGVPNATCNADCLRVRLEIAKEELKQKVITAVMRGSRLKIREEPKEMSISYLKTEDENICNPGFEMKGTFTRSLCVPCSPGNFLEKGYCIPCHLNQYSGKYAATACHNCFEKRVTRSRGSTSEEDCYLADPDVLLILILVFITMLPILFLCCCWTFTSVFGESAVGKCLDAVCIFLTCKCHIFRKKKLSQPDSEGAQQVTTRHSNSKTQQRSRRADIPPSDNVAATSKKKPVNTSDSDFIIPSVRHSSGRDFFYKQNQKTVTKGIPPPPLPPRHVNASGDKANSFNDNKRRTHHEPANRNKKVKMFDAGDDILPRFSDRVLKNPPMYNAIMKTKNMNFY